MQYIVAASQHRVQAADSWQTYCANVAARLDVLPQNVKIALFPEYGAIELSAMFPLGRSITAELADLQELLPEFVQFYSEQAQKRDMVIVAPGLLVFKPELNNYVNRSWVLFPDGQVSYQDKQHLTQYETTPMAIARGDALHCFHWQGLTFAVAICYDSEFPQQVMALTNAGAELILVPACTDKPAGHSRVAVSCRARALENQCYVLQAPLRGEADWSELIDVNVGQAGLYTPIDIGFNDDGIQAVAADDDDWLVQEIDPAKLQRVRTGGQVLNFADQQLSLPATVTRVSG